MKILQVVLLMILLLISFTIQASYVTIKYNKLKLSSLFASSFLHDNNRKQIVISKFLFIDNVIHNGSFNGTLLPLDVVTFFESKPIHNYIHNTIPNPMPLPPAILLFTIGLVGLVSITRKRI